MILSGQEVFVNLENLKKKIHIIFIDLETIKIEKKQQQQ